jgi:hypothetical protein
MNNETIEKKETNMKTIRITLMVSAALAALALTTAAIAGDGIAASPKVRQILNERKASTTPMVAAAPAMACPKCADVRTTEVNREAKGATVLAGAATKIVTRHTCAGCEVKLTTVGEGKAKHTVAAHKCTAEVPNNLACCASN